MQFCHILRKLSLTIERSTVSLSLGDDQSDSLLWCLRGLLGRSGAKDRHCSRHHSSMTGSSSLREEGTQQSAVKCVLREVPRRPHGESVKEAEVDTLNTLVM